MRNAPVHFALMGQYAFTDGDGNLSSI